MAGNLGPYGIGFYPQTKTHPRDLFTSSENPDIEQDKTLVLDTSRTINLPENIDKPYQNIAQKTINLSFKARNDADSATSVTQVDIQNTIQLASQYKSVVAARVNLSNIAANVHKDPAAQMSILLKAFSDCESFINSLLSDFTGISLPPEIRAIIASFRAMEAMIISQIKMITGLSLNEKEMQALLQQDPGKSKQNISINSLIQGDAKQKPNSPQNLRQEDSQQDETIYGIHSNPAKLQGLLASGDQKASKDLDKLVQQAASILESIEQSPEQNMGVIQKVIALINRGNQMCAVLDGLKQLPSGAKQFSSTKEKFDQITQRLRKVMERVGLPSDLLVKPDKSALIR